jgi:hypothetical protein
VPRNDILYLCTREPESHFWNSKTQKTIIPQPPIQQLSKNTSGSEYTSLKGTLLAPKTLFLHCNIPEKEDLR